MNVYFLRAKDNSQLIKIGKAKNVERRVAELQTGCHVPLVLMGSLPLHSEKHAEHIEERIHRHFRRYRVRGEWYRSAKPLREFIAAAIIGDQSAALKALEDRQ